MATIDQLLKQQVGDLVVNNMIQAAKIEEQAAEIAALQAKVAEFTPKSEDTPKGE